MKRQHGQPRRRRDTHLTGTASGFTLIELLVVISIIALLISILLPSLSRARAQSKSVKCLSNMRGMGQSGLIFATEHRNRFQLAAAEQAIQKIDPGRTKYEYNGEGELLAWPVVMAIAAGNTTYENNWDWGVRANNWVEANQRRALMDDSFDMAICPSDEVQISTPFYPRDNTLGAQPSELDLPDGNSYWGFLSYGINEDIVGADDPNGPNGQAYDCWKAGCRGQIGSTATGQACTAGDRLGGNLDLVFDPGTTLLIADAGPDSEDDAMNNPDGFANLFISAQANGPYLEDFQIKFRRRMPLKRHPESRVNVLFADFHAGTVRPIEFYSNDVLRGLPIDYDEPVRISPYKPFDPYADFGS